MKGYVVRGTDRCGALVVCCTQDGAAVRQAPSGVDPLFSSLDVASTARAAMARRGCTDVAIFRVRDDGAEERLPSYEEALTELAAVHEALAVTPGETACGAARRVAAQRDGAQAEVERLWPLVAHARNLILSASLSATGDGRAGLSCDEEPYTALAAFFEVEREAARIIPGLVCAECDGHIYRGQEYAGKGGHAAHKNCRNWPRGQAFKTAGSGS